MIVNCFAENREIGILTSELREGWTIASVWGGLEVKIDNGILRTAVNESTKQWPGFGLKVWDKKFTIIIKDKNAYLSFLINGGNNIYGQHQGGHYLIIYLGPSQIVDGIRKFLNKSCPLESYIDAKVIDDDPFTWQKVNIPISDFAEHEEIDFIQFQYQNQPVDVQIRDIKIVLDKSEVDTK
ncbi:MAG: hypothetical protein AABY84_07800 [Candidatus Firestonebacteria bacterium]